MGKIKKIIVGVSTYGTIPRAEGFIRSFWSNTEDLKGIEIIPVCVDDGTPDIEIVKERENFCKSRNFHFIHHEEPLGPYIVGQSIANFDKSADIIVLNEDSCQFLSPGWLSRVAHFFEKNDDFYVMGFPSISQSGFHDDDPRWDNPPLLMEDAPPFFASRLTALFNQKSCSIVLPWPPIRYIPQERWQWPILSANREALGKSICYITRDGREEKSAAIG